MKNKYFFLLAAVLFLSIGILSAGCASTAKPDKTNNKKEKEKDDEKEFPEIIKECKPITGLFTIYLKENDGSAYLEILPQNMDKIFLCTITRESADSSFLDSASLEDNYPFFFKKVNKRIQMIRKNVLFRADRDKPIFRAIEKGVSDSMLASSPILSKPMSPTGAVLVNLADFFLIDKQNIAHNLSEESKADFSLDKDDSYFSILKAFPENVNIEATLHFASNRPVASSTSPDARSILLKYYYSISKLPEPGYVPRLADDRVGNFITMYQDYNTIKSESAYVRFAERWRLEKQDPNAELSPPKKPITFWLENTIPLEYRESIKKGILLWNKAFEKAGFKDAMEVKQQPDNADWDPADIRYNTIRWMVNPGAGYAVGPDSADPFTGEIYNADIRISADMLRYFYSDFEEYVNPLRDSANVIASKAKQSPINENASPYGTRDDNRHCNYASGLTQQAGFAMALLESRDFVEGKEKEMEQFVQDYLVDLAVHEVGHTLGLRHNFKASSIRSIDQLNNKEFTSKEGLTGSVMDYVPVNISLEPKQQGEYWHSSVGPYDCWAIEYAYKPFNAKTPDEELPKLKAIADRSTDPNLAYGTDEDCAGNSPGGIDPLCTMFDLGNNLIEYGAIRLKLADELWEKMEEKFTKPGVKYSKLSRVFGQGLGEYHRIASVIPRYIGGIYHSREHMGTGNGTPLKPVPAEKQREALDFLVARIFSISEKDLPSAKLLEKFAPDVMPSFRNPTGRAVDSREVQLHGQILSMQKNVLNYLFNPEVLKRLDNTSLWNEENDKFGLQELFTGLREGIWTELKAGDNNINSFRRNLQREHADLLMSIFKTAPDNIPSDAISLARSDLESLKLSILPLCPDPKLDTYTKAHLEDIVNRITAALEWKSR